LAAEFLEGKERLKIKSEASDVVVQQITVAPGGHTGWHSHHGPSSSSSPPAS
jgi:quercetin dioxygenase-like cupin family protein